MGENLGHGVKCLRNVAVMGKRSIRTEGAWRVSPQSRRLFPRATRARGPVSSRQRGETRRRERLGRKGGVSSVAEPCRARGPVQNGHWVHDSLNNTNI